MFSFSEFASKMDSRVSNPGMSSRYATAARTRTSSKSASTTDVSVRPRSATSGAGGAGVKGVSGGGEDGSISDSAVSSSLTEAQNRNRRSSLG